MEVGPYFRFPIFWITPEMTVYSEITLGNLGDRIEQTHSPGLRLIHIMRLTLNDRLFVLTGAGISAESGLVV